tara:strand:+ start:61 stop:654 length:594 start_codon:yes stop_codon:yes gene_type:complete
VESLDLSYEQVDKIDQYIQEIITYNTHTNIVGKSTLINPWKSHVLDSVQMGNFISNKKSSILDMGTGAGIPGIILAINKFTNVSLIDSNTKKIKFVNSVCSKLDINIKIYHQRIESLINKKFDYLISRALANLNKLFFYSQKLLNKHTILIFLKGKHTDDEINEAKRFWKFRYKLYQSISDERGNVVIIKDLMKIND